jgi:hypothetical protein
VSPCGHIRYRTATAGLTARGGLGLALFGGVVQGAAVVAAFALLGPVLGLRPRRRREPA